MFCCGNHGGVDEVLHDENGFMKDLNEHGDVVKKIAGIRKDHMQRSKCTNHPYVYEQRKEEARKNCQSKLCKMKEDNAKHMVSIDYNRVAVYILLKTCQQKGYT